MMPPRITARARAYIHSRDERHRWGLTPHEAHLFNLEVTRLRNHECPGIDRAERARLKAMFDDDQNGQVSW